MPSNTPLEYWLTPPDLYQKLDREFGFDFDPCPYPKPLDFDSLKMDWGQVNYVNPPFRKKDGGGFGPTAWVRKGIEENKKGKTVVFAIPTQSYVNLLLEAGAEIRSLGRVRWLEGTTKKPVTSPSPISLFVLRAKKTDDLDFWFSIVEKLEEPIAGNDPLTVMVAKAKLLRDLINKGV